MSYRKMLWKMKGCKDRIVIRNDKRDPDKPWTLRVMSQHNKDRVTPETHKTYEEARVSAYDWSEFPE